MSAFFLTGCRVSAAIGACVGHVETDGVGHDLHVTEKRGKRRRKILRDAARPVLASVNPADREGPLFRPMTPDGGFARQHLDHKTPWRLVKKDCRAAGIDPDRPGGRGIGIPSLRKTAINDAIRNGATMHEVRGSPATATFGRPSSTLSARRKTRRPQPGASRSVSRGARTGEGWARSASGSGRFGIDRVATAVRALPGGKVGPYAIRGRSEAGSVCPGRVDHARRWGGSNCPAWTGGRPG
jgi:hypothetical protein